MSEDPGTPVAPDAATSTPPNAWVVDVVAPLPSSRVRDVVAEASARLGLPPEKLLVLLENRVGPVTKGLPKASADRVADVLEKAGVEVLVRLAGRGEVSTPPSPATRSPAGDDRPPGPSSDAPSSEGHLAFDRDDRSAPPTVRASSTDAFDMDVDDDDHEDGHEDDFGTRGSWSRRADPQPSPPDTPPDGVVVGDEIDVVVDDEDDDGPARDVDVVAPDMPARGFEAPEDSIPDDTQPDDTRPDDTARQDTALEGAAPLRPGPEDEGADDDEPYDDEPYDDEPYGDEPFGADGFDGDGGPIAFRDPFAEDAARERTVRRVLLASVLTIGAIVWGALRWYYTGSVF